jgi:hypothetical protein
MQGSLHVTLLSLRRSQSGKVTQDFLLSAGREIVPALFCGRIPIQLIAKPRWHRVCRTAPVFVIELDGEADDVTHVRTGRLADQPMQIEVKSAVADRHQIDPPRCIGLSVDLDANRHRSAPIFLEPGGPVGIDEHVRIDVVDLDPRSKTQRGQPYVPTLQGAGLGGHRPPAIVPPIGIPDWRGDQLGRSYIILRAESDRHMSPPICPMYPRPKGVPRDIGRTDDDQPTFGNCSFAPSNQRSDPGVVSVSPVSSSVLMPERIIGQPP